MPYLNLDLDYFSHPKILRLSAALDLDASLYPIRLWVWAAKYYCQDGVLQACSKHEMESLIGWTGEKGKLADAMVKIGLIEETQDGFAIHDWLDHAGHLIAFKKRAKSAAKKRWKKYATSNAKREFTNAPNRTVPYQPNHTVPTNNSSALAAQSLMVDTVVNLWNQIPGVVKPKSITGPIRKRLLACLDKQPDPVWWTTYFDKIKDSTFLTGRKTDFAATLDWVLGPKNMAKILAGNYDERPTNGTNGFTPAAKIPPFPGPEDPIGRNLWRQAYGNPR